MFSKNMLCLVILVIWFFSFLYLYAYNFFIPSENDQIYYNKRVSISLFFSPSILFRYIHHIIYNIKYGSISYPSMAYQTSNRHIARISTPYIA